MRYTWKGSGFHITIWLRSLKGKHHLEDHGTDRKIECILEKYYVRETTGFMPLRIMSSRGPL
jgi:hypothetical protein